MSDKSVVSDRVAIERSIQADIHDLTRWCAYADWLTEHGDPRGEFMQVQISLEEEGRSLEERRALQEREAALLAEHEREWLGPMAALILDGEPVPTWENGQQGTRPRIRHRFRRGWLNSMDCSSFDVATARAMASSPQSQFLEELRIEAVASEGRAGSEEQYIDSYYEPGPDVPDNVNAYDGPGLYALRNCPNMKAVRVFQLGEGTVGPEVTDEGEGYWNCHTRGELAHETVQSMPAIEELYLLAHRVEAETLFALPMPNLRVLQLYHSMSYPLEILAGNKSLTNLTTIRCHPHAMEYDDAENGAYIRMEHLRAICRSPNFGKLTSLTLRLTDFGDAGAREIVESGILKRLKTLDLQGGSITDEGARLLAESPDIKNLRFLNLRSNALTEAGQRAIQALGIRAIVEGQHRQTGEDGEETPEYLYEGDIE